MAFVNWTPELSVGIVTIDRQHQRFIDLLNAFAGAVTAGHARALMIETLTEVTEYARTHFAYEEDLLETTGHPGYAAHRAVHARFAAEADAMLADLKAGNWVSTTQVLTRLRDWLVDHIRETDQQYAEHLLRRRAA